MNWKRGPPVLVGEKILWTGNSYTRPESGTIKWIGNIPEISPDWCVGIELDIALPSLGGDGFWKDRKLFECRSKHGLIVPMEEIQKLATKAHARPISSNYSHFKLDESQLRDFTHSDLRYRPQREIKKSEVKKRYSNSESKPIEEFFSSQSSDSGPEDSKKENRKSGRDVFGGINVTLHIQQLRNQDVRNSSQKDVTGRKNPRESESQRKVNTLNSFAKPKVTDDSQTFDSKAYINELLKNMNEVAGYFKEIKEGDERFEKEEPANNLALYDTTDSGHSKPKKLFSFLKWFNKKQKQEPNLKLFKDSSTTSSPMFPRRETSSCESIDTLFSTQTVRSFAYIPPTQYRPSAPPIDLDSPTSVESFCGDFPSPKNITEESESIYEKRKKRKAPEPPRLSRENSLPTTLERKKNDEDFEGASTFHRRTVSESFKDKKAGSYCHVQGKRKAPPPPAPPLYPNLQKMNENQYPSLYRKKKPAPPPPESSSQNQTRKDGQKEKETSQPSNELKKEKGKDLKDNGNEAREEKGTKINQTPKDRLTKDASLSPLPSRPWYKRSHRDSTGSNVIKKDLLKGFEKKKNKETDDWMPEVGFPRRSLSTESHSKFNIFSKLEKTEDKKKEEKRKSQISILTNISELDREAAEIVRKEQAEEKKMLAANDAKYYSPKDIKEKNNGLDEMSANAMKNPKASSPIEKNKTRSDKPEGKSTARLSDRFSEPQAIVDHSISKEIKSDKNQAGKDENLKTKGEILKDKENNLNPDGVSNDNPKNLFSPNVLADLTNSSNPEKISKPSQSSSQARLNFFNVQNKELNYLNEPWVCQKCTLENPGWRVFCEMCSSVKPKFPVKNAGPNAKPAEDKAPLKTQSIAIKPETPKELKPAPEELKQPTPKTSENESEKDAVPKVETLDELRKKRMNFFTSKIGSSESDKNESETTPGDSKMKLKQIAKEMRESFPEEEDVREDKKPKERDEEQIKIQQEEEKKKDQMQIKLEEEKNKALMKAKLEEEKNKAQIKMKQEEEKRKEQIKIKQEEENNKAHFSPEKKISGEQKNIDIGVITKENKHPTPDEEHERKENREEPVKPKEKPRTGLLERKDDPNTEKVIEAYVITKTIVLEDVIVKKPDRGKKVSAAVQTKSSLPTAPEKVVQPPPRMKRTSLGSQTDKGTQPESPAEDGAEQTVRNEGEEDLEELTNKLTQAKGLADFRAKIETMPLNTEMNTVAVNRLLRKLEAAINCGDDSVAAGLAKELALMKINCSVTRQVTPSPGTSKITIDLYIEDKLSHQGPIPLEVSPTMSLLQLKKKIHQEFSIPLEVQRWILGKKLATDDNKTLESEGVKSNYCPLFLYLVAPDNRKPDKETVTKVEENAEPKPQEGSQRTEENPAPKGKGWYYNYEEDHYSYCEDSEDDSKSSSPDLSSNTKETMQKVEIPESNLKKTESEQGIKKPEKFSVFDLKSKDVENETEKELKFISINFVKQKVEKLNKTFAENAKPVKPPLRSSRSPETWKCGACNIVNSPGRLNCSSCNAKKAVTGPNNTKINSENREPLKKEVTKTAAAATAAADDNIHYKALMELQDADLVPNSEPFSCSICLVDYGVGEGVTLKDCLHTFCRTCLIGTVQFSEDAEVKCPYLDETYSCPSVLQQREIKALVPKGIFELHLAKSVKEAENKIENAFHCKTPDCKGWCIYEDNVNEFRCPVCKFTNCLTCQAVHNGINCKEYQERMKDASETDVDAKKTRDMLNEMVEKGEAMVCPKCQVVLMKKWGCDWLKCSMCKTEICWVTRGFRWGPEGKGDTSGGCKCGVNGVKCHPKCNYCH